MGYKILGYVVWQGGKWYVRRRLRGMERKLAVGGVVGLLVVGAALTVQRQRGSS